MSKKFKPSNFLKECIEKHDLNGMANALFIVLNTDKYFYTINFDDVLNYIRNNVPDFIQPDTGEEFLPEDQWTEDYWIDISVKFRNNPRMEYVNQLKKMSAKLYPKRK